LSTPETINPASDSSRKRLAFIFLGYLFFAVGLIGVALPVLPTTVFWVVAAICFARSSPRMYQRILTWPRIGSAVEDFVANGVIKRRSKVIAISGMAVAAIVVALAPMEVVPTVASLAGIAVGAIYVLTRPSQPVNEISR
jgi:uncharacterized membrane protein YbaN (DUF454 family)